MSSLAWNDALAACGSDLAFSQKEREGSWPQVMTPAQLAAIQRPNPARDPGVDRYAAAMRQSIVRACETGELACTSGIRGSFRVPADTATYEIHERSAQEFATDLLSGRLFPRPLYVWEKKPLIGPPPRERKMIELGEPVFWVGAHDFLRWLQDQGEAPSSHVLAWAAAVAAPVTETASSALARVAAERKAARGTHWTDEQKSVVRQEFDRRGGWRKGDAGGYTKDCDIQGQLAKDMGLKNRSSLERVLCGPPQPGEFAVSSIAAALTKAA